MRIPTDPRLWRPDPAMVRRNRRKAIVGWERHLAAMERRERTTIIAGLIAGPVLMLLLALLMGWALHAVFLRLAEGSPPPLRTVFTMVAALGAFFGIIFAGAGRWRRLTLGETVDEIVEQAARQPRAQGSNPFVEVLVLALLIGCTCGSWLVFDALGRTWTAWQLRSVCRWRAAAALAEASIKPTGVAVSELLQPGETAEKPGRLLEVLRYLVVHQWIEVETQTATIYPRSPSMREESWLDAILGAPVAA